MILDQFNSMNFNFYVCLKILLLKENGKIEKGELIKKFNKKRTKELEF